ncbi:hypothetical protein [Catenulispora pinisilvae]|uniref:hypothetical protein n=1 Tax=Catenulispora pinisilvae TaxID=2705253 RepID=UPI0018926D99|nr:hypothetical protein [Catenulispora pinisilvae]
MMESSHESRTRGVVRNVNTGSVGNLVQAGDIRGGIDMTGDGIRIGGVQVGGGASVVVPSDLASDMASFLRQLSAGELAPRVVEQRAEVLADRLDDIR